MVKAVILYEITCAVCGHVMQSLQERPRQCWHCGTRRWDGRPDQRSKPKAGGGT